MARTASSANRSEAGELPPVAVLCGGRGTRLRERTREIPKALVEIGGRPILWHVVRLHAAQGFRRFILCTGYRRELIEDYVAAVPWPESIEVECLDTGAETPTGGRVHRAFAWLGNATLNIAYADGLADIHLTNLLAKHRDPGGLATMTVVQPRSQFGVASLDDTDRVTEFEEKPPLDRWVNGGFFCFEPGALAYIGESSTLEAEPLRGLAADGKLQAYRHQGFWACMDTYKDAVALNDRWARGDAPWAVWDAEPESPGAASPELRAEQLRSPEPRTNAGSARRETRRAPIASRTAERTGAGR